MIEKINKEIAKIDQQLDNIEAQVKTHKKRQAELEALIAKNSAMMDGVVICPKCEHKFFVGNEVSVEEIRKISSVSALKWRKANPKLRNSMRNLTR